jgi:hypothetical protein
MTETEFQEMLRDIEGIRKAVRRNNPVLRQILASRAFAIFTLAYGVLVFAFCLPLQFYLGKTGSLDAIPPAFKTLSFIALVLLLPAGGIIKWTLFRIRLAKADAGSNYMALLKTFYGGAWFHLNVPLMIAAITGVAFAISLGQAWYSVPICAVCFSLLFTNLGSALQMKEYIVSGWYFFVAGLVSLFFVTSAPFLWVAIVFGGFCIVFGVGGLLAYPRGGRG